MTIYTTVFNHKGGVGKTTLTVNTAAAIAKSGKTVLLVDSDPQCNLTSYLFEDSVLNELLNNSDGPKGETLWSAVKPVKNGEGPVRIIDPYETSVENLFILPGDIRLSEFELFLADSWAECFKRSSRGLRAVRSIYDIAANVAANIDADYVFFDTGPNIGPLNQSILLGCDCFSVPVACDLFSVRALSTLGQAMKNWVIDLDTITQLAPDDVLALPGLPKLLGYIPQRFRVYGGQMTIDSAKYMTTIHKRIYTDLVSVLREANVALADTQLSRTQLGQVKDFGRLVQLAQEQGVPIFEVEGAAEGSTQSAFMIFEDLANEYMRRAEILCE